jgi:hypothetical protein
MSYSDGKARDVTVTGAPVLKGQVARVEGWNGIYENDQIVGKLVAMTVDPTVFHYFPVPAGVGVNPGDLIYITAGNVLSATSAGNSLFAKTDKGRDGGGVVGARILNVA